MDPLPDLEFPGDFPTVNVDGTYTLSAEYVQKLATFLVVLVNYTVEQYSKCARLTKPQLTKELAVLQQSIVAVRIENAKLAWECEELRQKLRNALVDLALASKKPYGQL